MPNTLKYIIIAGLFSFACLIFMVAKIFVKLRKEELALFPKHTEISEPYNQFEIITFSRQLPISTPSKRRHFQYVNPNYEIIEAVC